MFEIYFDMLFTIFGDSTNFCAIFMINDLCNRLDVSKRNM